MTKETYSIRQAKHALTMAIRDEIAAARNIDSALLTRAIYRRESAVRALVVAVRADQKYRDLGEAG